MRPSLRGLYDATHGLRSRPHAVKLGSWARAGEVVGVVAAVEGGEAALFEPGERRVTRVPVGDLQPVPAAAIDVTATVALPLPHGVGEETVRRWLAALVDPVLRSRAREALEEAGLDPGVALPEPEVEVRPAAAGSGARCLCGALTPAADGAVVACAVCGRQAAAPPARTT